MEMWQGVREWFWDPTLWLPPNATWEMLKDRTNGVYYPDFYDLWMTFPIAILLLLARYVWEKTIAYPVGRHFKISEKLPRQALANPLLEKSFRKHHKILPPHKTVEGLAKQLDWSTRQVERWWRRRKVQGKPSEMTRFTETSWRFLVYVVAFWSGLYILWDKPWLWDTKHFWYAYPIQSLSTDIKWYYLLELSLYVSLALTLIFDVKRKDFLEMFIHHIVTISIIVASWTGNMVRIGTVVLCTHDTVDWILELGKLTNYLKWQKICDSLFVVFTVMWFISRISFYPLWILRSSLFEGHVIIGCFTNIYYMYNGLLLALQVLHIIWFITIVRMVVAYIIKGRTEKDARSESETETQSEDEFVSYDPDSIHQTPSPSSKTNGTDHLNNKNSNHQPNGVKARKEIKGRNGSKNLN